MNYFIAKPDICEKSNPQQFKLAVEAKIAELGNLATGAKILFNDGELVGVVVDRLFSSTAAFPDSVCRRFINQAPCLKLVERGGSSERVEICDVFSWRKVISKTGQVFEQTLQTCMGEPAWVNVGHDEEVVRI